MKNEEEEKKKLAVATTLENVHAAKVEEEAPLNLVYKEPSDLDLTLINGMRQSLITF